MFSLSDNQLTAITSAAGPLQPNEREAFLVATATMFQGRSEVGDGELGRAIRDRQRQYFRPPIIEKPPQQLLHKVAKSNALRLRCIEYPISRAFCRNKLLDRAIAEKQFSAAVAALQEVGALSGLRIEAHGGWSAWRV